MRSLDDDDEDIFRELMDWIEDNVAHHVKTGARSYIMITQLKKRTMEHGKVWKTSKPAFDEALKACLERSGYTVKGVMSDRFRITNAILMEE